MLVSLIRSVILYFLLILAIRLMGKRQIGELEPSEFVVALLIADLAAVPMQDLGIPLLSGVIPILTILAVEVLLSVLSYHFIWVRKVMCGKPVILMENGLILHKNLKKTRLTTDELTEKLREKGILDLETVKYAIMETDGQISAFLNSLSEPATRKELNVPEQPYSLPFTLVCDGKLIKNNLSLSPYTEETLYRELKKRSLTLEDIFLLTSDEDGKLYIARKEH